MQQCPSGLTWDILVKDCIHDAVGQKQKPITGEYSLIFIQPLSLSFIEDIKYNRVQDGEVQNAHLFSIMT